MSAPVPTAAKANVSAAVKSPVPAQKKSASTSVVKKQEAQKIVSKSNQTTRIAAAPVPAAGANVSAAAKSPVPAVKKTTPPVAAKPVPTNTTKKSPVSVSLQKKNLFGYGAYDRDPYNSAYSYDTYAEGIDFVAKMLAKTYLNPAGVTLGDGDVSTGRYYTSPTLIGINTKYSTDPNWCTKVFSYMTYFYDKL